MDFQTGHLLIIVLSVSASLNLVNGNYTTDTLLRTTLRTGYERTARPGFPTTVHLFYFLRTLQSLDIQNQIMTTTGWLAMRWNDPRLVWNASEYSNISEIDANWVWRPEHYITNSAGDFTFFGYDNDKTRFHLFSDGTVRWDLPFYAKTTCDVSIARFPFDNQSCYIQVYFMEVNNVDVKLNVTSGLLTVAYLKNGEWKLDGGEVRKILDYSCCPASQVSIVEIHLSFTRLRPFYVINIIVPAVLLSVCMVWTFLLPTDCGERLGFSLTILLSYTVLMSIISEMMPTTSKETPFISIYLLLLLSMCSFCLLNIVLHVKLYYKKSTPPRSVQKVISAVQRFAFLRCSKPKDRVNQAGVWIEETDSNNVQENHTTNSEEEHPTPENKSTEKNREKIRENSVTWPEVSMTLDRLLFYFYAIMVLALTVIFVAALNGAI